MDWIINGLCVTWAVKSAPTIVSHHLRHECKRLCARQRRNIGANLSVTTVTDNTAALLHMLPMTNRFVHCLRRRRFSLTWDKSLILSRIPPCFLTALKWQECAWIHSVACGAPAGLLHRLPQREKVPLSERKQTGEVLSECWRVKGSAQEAGLAEGKKSCMDISRLVIWLITRRPKGKGTGQPWGRME